MNPKLGHPSLFIVDYIEGWENSLKKKRKRKKNKLVGDIDIEVCVLLLVKKHINLPLHCDPDSHRKTLSLNAISLNSSIHLL